MSSLGVDARSGFWSDYRKSLKSLDVEEPIDLYVHRPLAYVLAKLLLPTPISPNLVTIAGMACGVAAGYLIVAAIPHHFQWAALCSFVSTVLDCADGQLARLRKTSSVIGRMLDGCADMVVTSSILAGGAWYLRHKYGTTELRSVLVIAFVLISGAATAVQTTLFDHYKTVFMKLGVPGFQEAESYAEARKRYAAETHLGPLARVTWRLYLFFIANQSRTVRRYDPNTVTEYSTLGAYEPARAQLYRDHAGEVMRTWRRWFGYGSLMIGITLALALELPEVYLLLRLTLYGFVFYGPLMLRQREASRRALQALGVAAR
jgi:phosphatidylglycerophosphate synthase